MAHKRLQYPAKIGLLCQPLDGDHRAPADLHSQEMAGVHWLPVQQDRAAPHSPRSQARLAPSIEVVAEHLEERRAVVNLKLCCCPLTAIFTDDRYGIMPPHVQAQHQTSSMST